MSPVHCPKGRLASGLVVFFLASLMLLSSTGATFAAPVGTHFDHIVIIAMENQPLSILGSGSTPFLDTLSAQGSILESTNHYPDSGSGGCSAACYVEFTSGGAWGVSDGWSCCLSQTPVVDQLSSAGLTWAAYCASGCPRGLDHFPFPGYTSDQSSTNVFQDSTVSTSTLIARANGANPPNYLWYTPTDSQNMHDNSVSSGDTYLKTFLVGSGSVASPATGSLLATALFTNPSYRTLLWIWWDECGSGGSPGGCDSNSDAPNVEYGSGIVKQGYQSTASYTTYSELAMIEDNWGLSRLGSASGITPVNDIFVNTVNTSISASFTYTPTALSTGTMVTFTGSASGGAAPYSYSWNFGDGASATGVSATHSFTKTGTYAVVMTVTDSNSTTTNITRQVTVSNQLPISTFLFIGLIAGGAVGISVFLARYYSRNRKLSSSLKTASQN